MKQNKQGQAPLLFIPMEVKVREFHAKLLLAMIAVENGFRVIIGGKHLLQEQLQLFDKGIYLDKSIASSKIKWFKRFRKLGNIVTALDEEGLVFPDAISYQNMRVCEQALEQTKIFFAWGQVHKQVICDKLPAAEKQIICAGNPRFDMLRPEIREFYTYKAKKIADQYGKTILVNSNLTLANHAKGNDYVKKIFENYLTPSSDPDFIKKWTASHRKMFEKVKELLPVLSLNFPEHSIILRPHPTENFNTWKELTQKMSNVFVRAEGYALEWIKASDVLIHFGCTTAIEAYMMGVEAIAYHPINVGEFQQTLPHSLSLKASSSHELVDMVNKILGHTTPNKKLGQTDERSRIIRENVSSIEGELASDKIVMALKKNNVHGNPQRTVQEQLYKYWLTFLFRIKDYKRLLIGPRKEHDDHKFPGLELSEVEESIAIMRAVTGRFSGVVAEPAGRTCFLLYSE